MLVFEFFPPSCIENKDRNPGIQLNADPGYYFIDYTGTGTHAEQKPLRTFVQEVSGI